MELIRGSHSFGESNYHLQFTPKYRRDIFVDGVIKEVCADCFAQVAKRLGVVLAAVEFGPDHVHLFVCNCKNYSPAELARRFKGASSRLLRLALWERVSQKLWGDSFWSDGFFYRSVGAVTSDSIKYYVEHSQRKHWNIVDFEFYEAEKSQLLLKSFAPA